ncbi:MAG: signal peptidase II [Planctomyces sp.]
MNRKLPANRMIIYLIVAGTALTVDLWSKYEAFSRLGVFGRTGWLLDSWVKFEFHTNLNYGALWGMGQGFASGFAILSIAAFAGIIYWLFFLRAAESLWITIALSLVTGGTLGNLYDRLGLHGVHPPDPEFPGRLLEHPARAVRDFFHFRFGSFEWAIFNVADVCLVTGAIMLMLHSMKYPAVQPETGSKVGLEPSVDTAPGKLSDAQLAAGER